MTPRAEDDPKTQSRAPALLGVLIAALVLVAVPVLFVRASERRAAPAVAPMGTNDEMLAGQRVYQRVCVGCHEARGTGRPGRYPSLVASPWLLADPETPIRVVLLGMTGPIESGGQRYDSLMPNLGVNLTDEEVANVLTFCRATWGNQAPAIKPEDVARVRASLGGRTAPWAGGAELLEAKKADARR